MGLLKPGTYTKYIEYLKNKPIPQGTRTEKHHIIPRHQGGGDEASNIVTISVRDHIFAHLLLYLEKGENNDLLAYTFRKYSEHVDLRSHGQRMALINRTLGRTFWDSLVQQRSGRRGGPIGGSRNTQAQWEARSQVGRRYGRQVGLSNQSQNLRQIFTQILVFQHLLREDQFFYIGPCESVMEVVNSLNQECENRNLSDLKVDLQKVRSGGPFYTLIKGEKNRAYGWTILEVLDPEDLLD